MASNGLATPLSPEEQRLRAMQTIAQSPMGSSGTAWPTWLGPQQGAPTMPATPVAPPGGLIGAPTTMQTMQAPATAAATGAAPPAATAQQPGAGGVTEAQYREVNPLYRTVQDNETVRGQLGEIMAEDSPLLQRARAKAAQYMNGSGLLNSSMNAQAGVGAMLDQAVPIATSDAQIRSQAASQNQSEGNTTLRFNADQFGQNQQFNAGAKNQLNLVNVQEAGANSRLATQESGLNTRQQVSEKGSMDRLNISEAGQTLRAREGNETQLTATKMNNDTTRYGVDVGAATQRYTTDKNNETQRYGIDVGASTQRYGIDVGASTSRYVADTGASTARYTADLSASTQQSIAQLANQAAQSRGGADLLNSAENRIAIMMTNPDISAADKNKYVENQYNSVRNGLSLLGGVNQINLAVK